MVATPQLPKAAATSEASRVMSASSAPSAAMAHAICGRAALKVPAWDYAISLVTSMGLSSL